MPEDQVLLFEDFDGFPDGPLPEAAWWVEGGERVAVEGGRLRVTANPEGQGRPGNVCTVWHRRVFSGDLRVEFDTRVLASSLEANNINFFMLYSDPEGRPLFDTRASRADGAYAHYHGLDGYIFTFLNDFRNEAEKAPDGLAKARMRMRRCPGFQLMTETYAYHCRAGVTYHVTITKQGKDLAFAVDGTVYLRGRDEASWTEGLLGLRTFQTDLWWDNVKVVAI